MTLSHKTTLLLFVHLIIIHIVGVIGLNIASTKTIFQELTSLNLLISYFFVFLYHKKFDNNFFIFFVFSFCLGLGVEILGVKTGFPFGNYTYTSTLGIRFLEVPLMIGVNWAVLTYCTASLVEKLTKNVIIRVFLGALTMVSLDVLLEFFAIKHSLWIWTNASYPSINNFIGWFVCSLFTHTAYVYFIKKSECTFAVAYLALLATFLMCDHLISKF
jgi:uncharacterized membrane protein